MNVLDVYLSLLSPAPCTADNVEANMDCENNTARVSWPAAQGANSYVVTATGENGHQASCETDEHSCNVTELQCGQMYNVSLTSISDHCQTETNTGVTFSTRELSKIVVNGRTSTVGYHVGQISLHHLVT